MAEEKILIDVPKGTIVAWYSKNTIPPRGWVFCDGANGTPDLSKKYLVGTNDNSIVGNPDGSDSHQHSFSGRTSNSESGTFWTFDDPNANQHPGASGLDHNHSFSGSTSSAGNLPPSIKH